jgi:hypothetical protein
VAAPKALTAVMAVGTTVKALTAVAQAKTDVVAVGMQVGVQVLAQATANAVT